MKRITVLIILLVVISSSLVAQPRAYKRDCVVCSIDLGGGYYIPGMDYLNDSSYLSDVEGVFNGGIIGTGLINIKFGGGLHGGIGAGYWNDRVNVKDYTFPGGIVRDELLGITMIPVIAQLKYEFSVGGGGYPGSLSSMTSKVRPYIGGGTMLNFMRQKFRRVQDGEVTDEGTLTGINQTYQALAGVKFVLTSFLDFGIEYNHVFGGFDQAFLENDVSVVERVSLAGPMLQGKLVVYLYERRGFANTKALKRFKGKYKTPKRR